MPKRPTHNQELTFEQDFDLTADDLTRPGRSRALWRDPASGRSYLVSIEWANVRGRAEPVAFSVRGAQSDPPAGGLEFQLPRHDESPATIPAALLRRLAPGDLIARARRDAGLAHTKWREAHPGEQPEPDSFDGGQEWTLDRLIAARSAAMSEDRTTATQAALVTVWWDARRAGLPTTQAVADHFGITYTNAATRVARARKAGLLPRTTRGRALADHIDGGDR